MLDQNNQTQEEELLEVMIRANYLQGTVFIIAITNQESHQQMVAPHFSTISRVPNITKHKETTQLLTLS
jgi:hypothetical protein